MATDNGSNDRVEEAADFLEEDDVEDIAAARERRAQPEESYVSSPEGDIRMMTADVHRHSASANLVKLIDLSAVMAEDCARIALYGTKKRVENVGMATRLTNAAAHAARAMAQVHGIEQRDKRIIEVVQSPKSEIAYSNSNPDAPPPPVDKNKALDDLLFTELQHKMLLYMNIMAEESLGPEIRKNYGDLLEPKAEETSEASA